MNNVILHASNWSYRLIAERATEIAKAGYDHGESTARHPEDHGRWQECWNRYDLVQMIGFHNAVQGMPQRSLWEDDGFLVFARGDKGIVAINKTDG